MSEVFFTSDTHFGHERCATHFRFFKSVEEHDELLIKNWNELVKKSDRIYHLGDFSLCGWKRSLEIQKRLNGQKFLIRGNHDNDCERLFRANILKFEWLRDVAYLKINGQKMFLSHYAHKVWRSSHKGSWHLYGHSHGSLYSDNSLSMDVGVDCNNFKPFSFDEVKEVMMKREFVAVDHHVNEVTGG